MAQRKNPGIENVFKIAICLNVSLDELIDDEEDFIRGL